MSVAALKVWDEMHQASRPNESEAEGAEIPEGRPDSVANWRILTEQRSGVLEVDTLLADRTASGPNNACKNIARVDLKVDEAS